MSSPLGRHLLRVVLGLYFVIAVSLTLIQLFIEYRHEKDRLNSEVEQEATTFAPIFAQALWNFDFVALDASAPSLLRSDSVIGIAILDSDFSVLYPSQQKSANLVDVAVPVINSEIVTKSNSTRFNLLNFKLPDSQVELGNFSTLYSYNYEIQLAGETEVIGYLKIYSTSDIVIQRAMSTFIVTIINAFLKTMCLWIIFLVVLNKIVARPLNILARAVDTVNPDKEEVGDFSQELLSDPQFLAREDEIGTLIKSFHNMEAALISKNHEIKAYQRDLEQKVAHRTMELKLISDQLEQALKAKSEFLATMSHEIRTPMNGVLGMAQLLKDSQLSAKQMRYVDVLNTSGRALLSVLDNVLDFSKIEAGKMEIESITFNIEDVIDECLDVFSLKAIEKNVRLIGGLYHDVPKVLKGDPTRLRQVLMNLLSNAIKFTFDGEVILKVTLISISKHGHAHILFEVIDSGIGISAEAQGKLFSVFGQTDKSITRKFGGTGLGLAICKQLIQLMGGEIGVNSEIDQGATFWARVNFALVKDVEARNYLANVSSFSGQKLLIIDASESFIQLTSELARSWEMRVDNADSASRALEILSDNISEDYDIILLDQNLCDSTGIELAEKLCSGNFCTESVIILVADLHHAPDDESLEKTNISFVLERPLPSSAIRKAFQNLMKIEHETLKVKEINSSDKPSFSDVHALVADDNEINQMVIKSMLNKFKIDPIVVDDGRDVLQHIIGKTPIDIIFMDCEMKYVDGWEAAEKIRLIEKSRQSKNSVKIVALTAHVLEGPLEKTLEAGMDKFVSKPVSVKSIEAVLNEYFPRNASGVGAREGGKFSAGN